MSQPEFEAHYAALKREIDALEADLGESKARKHFAGVRQRIETLYETLRENHLLLHTVLENTAASIYAKRKDGRYTYLNRGMEILCNVTREQCLGRTDFDQHASEVFNSIRAPFSKVDQSRRPVDVNEIARGVLQSLRGELKDHGVATETELASDLPPVDGHQGQLRQVVFNLVHNAIEAMAATTDKTQLLRVSTQPQNPNTIVVAVEDSGSGIDPRRSNNIFDAFVTTKANGMDWASRSAT